ARGGLEVYGASGMERRRARTTQPRRTLTVPAFAALCQPRGGFGRGCQRTCWRGSLGQDFTGVTVSGVTLRECLLWLRKQTPGEVTPSRGRTALGGAGL